MDALEHKILRTIRRSSLMQSGERLLVALSGGPDSVALLVALVDLAPQLGIRVAAAHVNHGLRGEESDRDECFVRDLCDRKKVHLSVARLPPGVPSSGRNLEAEIRQMRYARLTSLALRTDSVLATGHSLSDQAETVLMKLLRGAGPTGLSGIFPCRTYSAGGGQVRIVRPLLEVGRNEILGFLQRKGQTYCCDRTNEDLSLDRNWVRGELLPLLETRLNPSIVRVLGRSAELFREIEDYLDSHSEKGFTECLVEDEEVVLAARHLAELPDIIQRQVIRRALREARGHLKGVTQAHIDSIRGLVTKTVGRVAVLPGQWRVLREFDSLRFTCKKSLSDFVLELSIPGEVFLEESGRRVAARRLQGSPPVEPDASFRRVLLANLPGDRLVVRNRRPGDRITVSGKSRPLKRVFLERRIPWERRSRCLVITCGGHLLWVEGVGSASPYLAEENGRDIVEVLIF